MKSPVQSLTVNTYGTRGSQPICNPESVVTGGNTTCLRIESLCLPSGMALVIDAGTGFPPLARVLAAEGITGSSKHGDGHEHDQVVICFTHYHRDHTIGLTTAIPVIFNKKLPVRFIGPLDQGGGPKEMMQRLFCPPDFPAGYKKVASHLEYTPLDDPSTYVIMFHPKGGLKVLGLDEFERLVRKGGERMPFGAKSYYPLGECLVVRMLKTEHPQTTVSYRFDEMPTGKSFVFMTDNESMDGIPQAYLAHVRDADLLILDVQYDEATYYGFTAGFGHAWAGFAVRLANATHVKRLGTTHHDPDSTDQKVDAIVDEIRHLAAARLAEAGDSTLLLQPKNVFACRDYGRTEV
jgi:ribonuclease BN (tRNA processing enzyme)